MSTFLDDPLGAIRSMLTAIEGHSPEPKPLMVPDWLIELADDLDEDLDAHARRYGFDGYVTYEQPAREPRVASSAPRPDAPERSGSSRSPGTAIRADDPAPG